MYIIVVYKVYVNNLSVYCMLLNVLCNAYIFVYIVYFASVNHEIFFCIHRDNFTGGILCSESFICPMVLNSQF